jgi:diguanylate cyclase (GGDEF)-like protein/putative nucleotidyltransferase with HDIG domain
MRRAGAEKLRQQQELIDLHVNTVESLAIAIDAKDQTTHGHVRRTRVYAVELGKLRNVTAPEMEALKAGALLHDIGKLAVPESILNKPGKLTAAEFEKMKVHTVVGGDIIRRVNFPYPVEDVVRYHHEKWDGTGYPRGLGGGEIPLVARIISVVDFYDATRCDRPYRDGMTRAESLSLLQKMAGKSFDPEVVESFVQNVEFFDSLIDPSDLAEQVRPGAHLAASLDEQKAAPESHDTRDDAAGFRTIAEAQREVFALQEITQTIGSSLNLQDTVTLFTARLRAIIPFDTCVVFIVDEKSGKAVPVHASGEHVDYFSQRRVPVGEGITGWVIANSRSMRETRPELDLSDVPREIAAQILGVLCAPLPHEDGAFGAITLYSNQADFYTAEHARLLESVCLNAAGALNNALMFERTKESALTDPLTELPNARALHLMLQQRIAECRRLDREPVAVLSMDVDDFKEVNEEFGHGVGDRLLASVAAVIKAQLRQMDTLARYAGDEFIAVMPAAPGDVASMVAERIRTAVEAHKFHVRTGRTIRVGISVGICCFPTEGETADDLLLNATQNMQRNKQARKHSANPSPIAPVVSLDAYR